MIYEEKVFSDLIATHVNNDLFIDLKDVKKGDTRCRLLNDDLLDFIELNYPTIDAVTISIIHKNKTSTLFTIQRTKNTWLTTGTSGQNFKMAREFAKLMIERGI